MTKTCCVTKKLSKAILADIEESRRDFSEGRCIVIKDAEHRRKMLDEL